MAYSAEFTCDRCGNDFSGDWDFGDDVTCTHCGTVYMTDWDTDAEDNIYGPCMDLRCQGRRPMTTLLTRGTELRRRRNA